MKKIPNTQEISLIIMKPVAYAICEIGGDLYENQLEITFTPGDSYPDYTEFQQWIMDNIDGRVLNIEDVVNMVHEKLETEFHPVHLSVVTNVSNCRTHFDVTVIK